MNKKHYQLVAVIAVCLLIRWLPNIISPIKTFGYDFGFYLFALKNGAWNAWDGYGNFLFPILNALNISNEYLLVLSQLLLTVVTTMVFYFFWNKESKPAAFWTGLLYILSIAQTKAYLMFLWKNLFALIFFILILKFIKDKKWWLAITSGIIIFASHKTTSFIVILSLTIYGLYLLIKNKYYATFSAILIGLLITTYTLADSLTSWFTPFLGNPNIDVINGIFFSTSEYLMYSFPLIILGVSGLIFL